MGVQQLLSSWVVMKTNVHVDSSQPNLAANIRFNWEVRNDMNFGFRSRSSMIIEHIR